MTRKQVSFESREAFAKALIDGRRFYVDPTDEKAIYFDGTFIYPGVDKGSDSPFRYGTRSLTKDWDLYYLLYEEVEWWKDIPKGGRLCWVSDDDPNDRETAQKIYRCVSDAEFKFASSVDYYKYATPVTVEDLENEND